MMRVMRIQGQQHTSDTWSWLGQEAGQGVRVSRSHSSRCWRRLVRWVRRWRWQGAAQPKQGHRRRTLHGMQGQGLLMLGEQLGLLRGWRQQRGRDLRTM